MRKADPQPARTITVGRVQTGIRLEKRLLKVLKALARSAHGAGRGRRRPSPWAWCRGGTAGSPAGLAPVDHRLTRPYGSGWCRA